MLSTLTPEDPRVKTFPSIVMAMASPLGLVLGEEDVLADGLELADADGEADGELETEADGLLDGEVLGVELAEADGEALGDVEGDVDGELDTDAEGVLDGDALTELLGEVDGDALGLEDATAASTVSTQLSASLTFRVKSALNPSGSLWISSSTHNRSPVAHVPASNANVLVLIPALMYSDE